MCDKSYNLLISWKFYVSINGEIRRRFNIYLEDKYNVKIQPGQEIISMDIFTFYKIVGLLFFLFVILKYWCFSCRGW